MKSVFSLINNKKKILKYGKSIIFGNDDRWIYDYDVYDTDPIIKSSSNNITLEKSTVISINSVVSGGSIDLLSELPNEISKTRYNI